MMANSQVGPRGLLFNPTIIVNGWSPLLAPPNPRTRDELVGFTGEANLLRQCSHINTYYRQLHNVSPPRRT
jgi:hypothetical protein